jgi:hypothetical protein
MNHHPDLFPFPAISDEAVIAVNHFLEEFHTHFQHHYCDQIHRYYAELPTPARCNNQIPLPLDDPPF